MEYAPLSFKGMRDCHLKLVGIIGQRKLKDYMRRPPEELYNLEEDP